MKEIEVKILEIDKNKVTQALRGLKAKKVFDGNISTLFLDFDNGYIHNRKDVFRLRTESDDTELTYKQVKVNNTTKTAQEHTVKVSNLQTMLDILLFLGISVKQKMNKHRISYVIGDTRFDIDCYLDEFGFIPVFLEIEGPVESIKKYTKRLGFEENDCLPWATDELIAHYSQKHK